MMPVPLSLLKTRRTCWRSRAALQLEIFALRHQLQILRPAPAPLATQDKFPRAILPGTFDFGFTTGLSYKRCQDGR